MKLVNVTAAFILVSLCVYIMVIGANFFVPLITALIIWYSLLLLTRFYEQVTIGVWHMPRKLSIFFALTSLLIVIIFLLQLTSSKINAVVEVAPVYQANFERLMTKVLNVLKIDEPPNFSQVFANQKFSDLITNLASNLANMAGNTSLIILYVVFLLLEQHTFKAKLISMSSTKQGQLLIARLIKRIDNDMQTYIRIKSLMSFLSAILSYFIMILVDVDFAGFWAVLIFFFNFIPSIGSIIATAFPSLLALVQFETIYPFLIMVSTITGLQFIIGNVLEPRLTGSSLNLSTIAILLSMILLGSIWGVLGMVLCVPMLLIAMPILSYFPQTQAFAILLSENGCIRQDET